MPLRDAVFEGVSNDGGGADAAALIRSLSTCGAAAAALAVR